MSTTTEYEDFDATFFDGLSLNLQDSDIDSYQKKTSVMGQVGFTSRFHRNNAPYYFFGKKTSACSKEQKAALLALGMATAKAKQPNRLFQAAAPILLLFSDSPEAMNALKGMVQMMQRTNRNASMNDITGQRLAAAFPDFGACGAAMSNLDTPFCDIYDYVESITVRMPSVIAFPQAYQLDLDPNMKKLASIYNLKYWLNDVVAKTEVKNGPKFVYSYHLTGLGDKYKLYIDPSKLDKEVIKYLSVSPYDLYHLTMYHAAVVCALRLKKKVEMADLDALMTKWDWNEDKAKKAELFITAMKPVDCDYSADCKPMGNVSSSTEYISSRLTESASATSVATTALPPASGMSDMMKTFGETLQLAMAGYNKNPVTETPLSIKSSRQKLIDDKAREMTPEQRIEFRKRTKDPAVDVETAADEAIIATRGFFAKYLGF